MGPAVKFSVMFVFILIIYIATNIDLFAQESNHQQVFETQGIASSMGKLSTVSSDGPFDVLRNPATLTTQKEDNAGVISISREAYSNFNSSADASVGISDKTIYLSGYPDPCLTKTTVRDISFSSDMSRELSMNGGIAYSRRITDNLSAGIAANGATETMKNKNTLDMYMHTVITDTITNMDIYTADDQMYSDTEETEKNQTANLAFAVAYKFLNKYSAGIQTKVQYFKNEKTSNEESFSRHEASIKKTKDYNEIISPIIGLGFLYKDNAQEAGLLITSGRYMWERKDNELKYYDTIDPSNDYELNNSKLKKGKYIEGPGIIAGYYLQLIPLIGLAAEAGFILPLKYKEHILKDLSEERNYFEAESNVEKKFTFMINGGIKLNPYKDLTVALGGGYRLITNESTRTEFSITHQKSNDENDIKFTGYLGTLGIENKVFAGSKIIISMDMIYFKISYKGKGITEKTYPNDSISMDMEMEQRTGGFFINTGVAYVQYF